LARTSRSAAVRYVALTGTPGTGKSSCARALGSAIESVEVADLAVRSGAGRQVGSVTEVDLARLSRGFRRRSPPERITLVVGHLAHLLPIQEVVILRCHPLELLERLRRAHRGRASDRRENAISEALDQVLIESVSLGRTVREIDTTGRSPRSVALEVRQALGRPLVPRTGVVDWLADGRVTDFLLREPL
jgi:adenylate kinase